MSATVVASGDGPARFALQSYEWSVAENRRIWWNFGGNCESFFVNLQRNPQAMQRQFNEKDPLSIYDYSRHLIGHTLREVVGDESVIKPKKGKGRLGQMVEELFFGYSVNSRCEADFAEAHMELKCTPLLQNKSNGSLRIKERLVCSMIDYSQLVHTSFEDSHLRAKCSLMLLLFYLHIGHTPVYDLEFLFRVLWQLPEKDLILIKKDYDTIAEKVRQGEAHLLSEGDTLYLGAARKGHKDDTLQKQPYSSIKAKRRAFSLKPAYMRYVLDHVINSGKDHYSNYTDNGAGDFELVSSEELQEQSFERIILDRFKKFEGMNFLQICAELGIKAYQAKSKYADVCGLIASSGISKRLSRAEEFMKSGIVMKTVRLNGNGMPKESMSFKNIDYCEVAENGEWTESEAYEIFTNRFLFVVFKPVSGSTITVYNNTRKEEISEQEYVLSKVFFWTMPTSELELAQEYWNDIRKNVLANNINLKAFWKISDKRHFHVRPKAAKKVELTINPNGGQCEKYCYWLNAEYVKQIIDSQA